MTFKCKLVSAIRNRFGDILSYSIQSTQEQVKEWADNNLLPDWNRHYEIGARIEYCLLISGGKDKPLEKSDCLAAIEEYFK